ncbi:group I truncated hemoglobin [Marinagarivorans cellulosilyticus]|uniref:Hemoglobin n=1 Tax=Marinagarivorans cellulosilyticus TaxID=2721545 RepID=A0AAN1WJE5_9GAMM|nr:group 1 truncated hemoglobin [Marinagarivorans cellulosilyticus]BCD98738.1 hemoglobin [Marinagarivorans cellulosilyticus]
MKLSHIVLKLAAVVIISLCSACATTPQKNLFIALGGEQGVQSLVDKMITAIGKDPKIFDYFAETKVSRFRQKLYLHFCHVADGPCTYDGDTMIDVHTGMNINEADFNHLVDILVDAMTQQGIKNTTQNALLKKLAPLRQDIIYR